jgi:hypothetical protein
MQEAYFKTKIGYVVQKKYIFYKSICFRHYYLLNHFYDKNDNKFSMGQNSCFKMAKKPY